MGLTPEIRLAATRSGALGRSAPLRVAANQANNHMNKPLGYFPATRHPWPCTLFLLPLLLAYEGGVLMFGGGHPEELRNGADNWMRFGLTALGLPYFWLPPLMLVTALIGWNMARRSDRPQDMIGVLTGMSMESVAFALGLWGVSRALVPLMQQLGVQLEISAGTDAAMRQAVTYLGAGIYEEALFRLALYSAMVWLLRRLEAPKLIAVMLAAIASATLFSAAHHLGPYGQPFDNYLFLFRLAAGVYFALLYQYRGFGVVVGAHACYNLMVSVGAA
jgi:hypothetical protein